MARQPVFSSVDGSYWVQRSFQNRWSPATVSFGGGTFWLNLSGSLYSSTDGVTWSAFRYGGTGRVYPSGESLYFTDQYSARVWRISRTDPQGATETLLNNGNLPAVRSLATGGGRLVTVGASGSIYSSDDGVTLTNRSHFTNLALIGFAKLNEQFFAVDVAGGVFASANGADWTHLSDIPRASLWPLVSVTSGGGRIVATGDDGRSYSSGDGVQWTTATVGAKPFSGVAMNLLPDTQYYYRITATNSEGTAIGDKLTFTTLANTPPVATDDGPLSVAPQGATNLPVLANDQDPDGDTFSITSVSAVPHGTVAVTQRGLAYTPVAGLFGSDEFTYTISDSLGATATATVQVRTNSAPAGTAHVYGLLAGPGPFLLNVLDNDTDPDGDTLSLLRVDNSTHGTTTISGRAVSYRPNPGYSGSDQFFYQVGDSLGKAVYVKVTMQVLPARPATPAASLLVGSGETFFQTPPQFTFPDDTKISGFGPPALSDFRQIASTITLAVGRSALSGILFPAENGARSVLAASTKEVPGVAPSTFLSFSNPVVSPHGAVTFIARVKGPGARGVMAQGVWSTAFSSDGSLALVVKSGMPNLATGLPAGALLTSFASVEAVDGALYVLGQPSAPGGAVLFQIDATGARVLLREKSLLSPGVTIQKLSVLQPALASAGQGRWGGAEGLVAKATLSDKSTALLKIAADGTVSRLLSTWQAPAAGDSFAWSAFGLPALTPDGAAAFLGTQKTGTKPALAMRGLAATESKLTEAGETAPETGAQFASFYDPVAGDRGLAFLALLRGTGVTAANRTGLWALDSTGVFRQLLRTGPGALAGDPRNIRSLTTLAADAGAFGVGRSYNATGSLAVKVIFTNNTQAILRVDVP